MAAWNESATKKSACCRQWHGAGTPIRGVSCHRPRPAPCCSESMGSDGAVVGAGDAAALRLVLSVVGGSKVILDGGETNFAVGAVARGVG